MNKKIYKGLEIMEIISKGKIAEHQKFNFENNNFDGEVEYYNGTLYWLIYDEDWNLKDKKNLFDMFNIQSTMVADFEFLDGENEEIILLDLKKYSINSKDEFAIDLVCKINEIATAVNQIKKEKK